MIPMSDSGRPVPVCGILSVALTPVAWLGAAIGALVLESVVDTPEGVSMSEYVPWAPRIVVIGVSACVVAGVGFALIALARRERPRWLPALGLLTTILLVGLFHVTALPD